MANLSRPAFQTGGVFLCLLLLTGAFSCGKNDASGGDISIEETLTAKAPLLDLLPPERTGIDFQNQILETFDNNITTNINIYNGGGFAVADFNNDGLQDLYYVCTNGKNRLYLNKGGLKFEDITDAAGVGSEDGFETAVTAADVNADGFTDLYICRAGREATDLRRNKLYLNNGNLTFSERAKDYHLDDMSASTGANFFDCDLDGDLDLYLLNYPTEGVYTNKIEAALNADKLTYTPALKPRGKFDTDRFYRNDGPPQPGGAAGGFTDVSEKAGVWNLAYGLSVSVSDFNRDGWPDVYVGNDFIQPDILYINNRDGTFTNQISNYLKHSSQHTMGADLSDFDNDGLVDIFAVDMLPRSNARRKTLSSSNPLSTYTSLIQHGYFEPVVRNVLQRNNGNGTFSDVGCMAGVYDTDWSWSGLLFDADNDGLRDIHVTNGYRREVTDRDFIAYTLPEFNKNDGRPIQERFQDVEKFLKKIPSYKIRNFVFKNRGDWTFDDKSGDWMTMSASWSCGAAWADLDNDGDLDMVVNNLEEPSFVYENLARKNPGVSAGANFLQIKFQGTAANPFAVGASVAIYYGNGQKQFFENFPVRGIFSTVENMAHFGLGNVEKVDKLVIRWPDGKTHNIANIAANQRLVLRYQDATGPNLPSIAPIVEASQTPLFDITAQAGIAGFRHTENEFSDFETWLLNPWTETDLGPFLAKADVNMDGYDDFFVGNSFEKAAALFIQSQNGTFRRSNEKLWDEEKIYEDHGALFFDADGDNDPDLLVLSGGMEATTPLAWQNRLYLNDGKGNFSKSPGAMPKLTDIGGRAAIFDYDGDEDSDLFIGGRVTAGKWPLPPRSLVLRNDKGKFTDVTAEVGGDFAACGMVTDLQWANLDAEPTAELVVVGEFMPVSVFKFRGGKMLNISKDFGLENAGGLWNRLAIKDLDGDTDMDLVTGNFGTNTRLEATAEGPLRVFAKDFDGNGSLDPLLGWYENGKCYPINQKELLFKQLPPLKKKFLYAKDFSQATMDKVYPQKDLDAALNLAAHTLETSWWENRNGKLVRHALPPPAQVSPVQGILLDDFNGDGWQDILLAGNKYGLEVETNRCDSGSGALLTGDGKGNFAWAPNLLTGFWAQLEARDMIQVGCCGNGKVLVANNDGPLQMFARRR